MEPAVYGILLALLSAHIVVAITATVVVLRDKSLEKSRMVGQLAVSWLVLYAGPLFILYVTNEHSPDLLPQFVTTGILHYLLFAPIKPPHSENPLANDGGYYQNADASDIGFDTGGTCGVGGE